MELDYAVSSAVQILNYSAAIQILCEMQWELI